MLKLHHMMMMMMSDLCLHWGVLVNFCGVMLSMLNKINLIHKSLLSAIAA